MLSLRSDYQPPYPAYPGVFNLLLQFSSLFTFKKILHEIPGNPAGSPGIPLLMFSQIVNRADAPPKGFPGSQRSASGFCGRESCSPLREENRAPTAWEYRFWVDV